MHSCSGGRQLPDKSSAQRGPPPRCAELEAGVCRLAQQDCIARGRSGALRATDTLSVAWLRGTFGRGAGASSTGFRDHMDRIKHVYTKVGPSGVPPPGSHECSHRIPHSRLSGIACQVGGSLQKLLHESIGSIWRHFQ